MDKAIWDVYHTKMFCEVCKEQVQNDNTLLDCLNRKAYKHLEEQFFAIIKARLARKQFKNQWDMLKGLFVSHRYQDCDEAHISCTIHVD
jgi:hypothetical protein